METSSKAHVVAYFFGVAVAPPLSAVRVFAMRDIRPSADGEVVSEKTICFAKVAGQDYPCLILAVDYVSSLEEVWNDAFGSRQPKYEDMGRRWTAELELNSLNATATSNSAKKDFNPRTQQLPVSSTETPTKDNVLQPEPDTNRQPITTPHISSDKASTVDSVDLVDLTFTTTAGSLNGSESSGIREPSPEYEIPVTSIKRKRGGPPKSAAKSQVSFPSNAGSTVAATTPGGSTKTVAAKTAVTASKNHPNARASLARNARSKTPYEYDVDWDSDIDDVDEQVPDREETFLESDTELMHEGSLPTELNDQPTSTKAADNHAFWTFPQSVHMISYYKQKNGVATGSQDLLVPVRVRSSNTGKWIESRQLLEEMLGCKTWRSAVTYAARKVFSQIELRDSICSTLKLKGVNRGRPLFDQEKLAMLGGLTGLYCKERGMEMPAFAQVKHQIIYIKVINGKLKKKKT